MSLNVFLYANVSSTASSSVNHLCTSFAQFSTGLSLLI